MTTCFKTVIVLSETFIQEVWPQVSSSLLRRTSEVLGGRIRDDVVAVMCDSHCAVPPELFNVAKIYPDDGNHWWKRFVVLLTTSGLYIPPVFLVSHGFIKADFL